VALPGTGATPVAVAGIGQTEERLNSRDTDASPALIAARWARTLLGIRDTSIRIGWVRNKFTQLPVGVFAGVLAVIHARAEQRDPAYSSLLLCVSMALSAPDMEDLRYAIGRAAEAGGLEPLSTLFAPRASVESSEDDLLDPEPSRPISPAASGSRPLTLGERKSLARRRDRTVLAKALRDPHPEVIRILLDNPALVENDVVRLCARRPIQQEVLELVFRHPRWILRPSIRRTLALNPHTPEALALQLLPHLTTADLRDIAGSLQLSEKLRKASHDYITPLLH
jgi:hypothetical protein